MRYLNPILSLVLLLLILGGCTESEQSKAARLRKKVKTDLAQQLTEKYEYSDDCAVRFWTAGPDDDTIVAFVCATYWNRGITPEELLKSEKEKMVTAGFKKMQFERGEYSKTIALD